MLYNAYNDVNTCVIEADMENNNKKLLMHPNFMPTRSGAWVSANPQSPVMRSTLNSISFGDARVRKYTADLQLNGSLKERFVYWIEKSDSIRMLYRNWEIPLTQVEQNSPYVELQRIKAPSGAVPYAKMNGKTRILADNGSFYSESMYDIWSTTTAIVANRNEAGYYAEDAALRFPQTSYRTQIHPLLLCDEKSCLFSLDLSGGRLSFRHIEPKLRSN